MIASKKRLMHRAIRMRLLKAIITLGIVVIVCNDAESKMTIEQIKNTMKPYKNKCIRTSGVDPALVEGTKNGDFPEDRTLMCFFKCLYNMMKVIKNDEISLKASFTTIDLMVPDEFVPPMKEIIEKCLEKTNANGRDLCEKCWMQAKCFYEGDKTLYFFP